MVIQASIVGYFNTFLFVCHLKSLSIRPHNKLLDSHPPVFKTSVEEGRFHLYFLLSVELLNVLETFLFVLIAILFLK